MNLEAGIAFLAQGGLNLFAAMKCAALPQNIRQLMIKDGLPLDDYQFLVLTGHGGGRLWQALQEKGMDSADPVDQYSTQLTHQFIVEYLDNAPFLWLYPNTSHLIPLQQLGETAGWSHPSPLGSGISPTFGVWFAYRTAFLTNAPLSETAGDLGPSPCDACEDKPCISTCPVGAVQFEGFRINECVQYRLETKSPCADRCLARMACPYFPQHRYSLEQIQYHYSQSLGSIRAWYMESSS